MFAKTSLWGDNTDLERWCAHKFVITAFLTGSRILGRSFMAAYKQAQASSQYQRAQVKAGNASASGRASLSSGMTLDEACRILNVKAPSGGGNGQAGIEEVLERYKRLFDANDPEKGGSFYLQSKIVRAKERLEAEIGPLQEKAQAEAETKEGWNPKVYKDR
ncbi:Mitochondrial import inner membrane translocase subunit TIM16 [Escovopsis weberi]|uniref:Mitochondrial import inner membrane translocase subunit TIM16 n=1 Tax=Escovopsis weberi TaxID=150374 RepID=A0A0M8N4V0_ESCWE|nr:Mitochondrial import inner membrane translocase subunit TIM16 [Escovopsis weberi]